MSQAVRDGDFVHEIYEILPHADFSLIEKCVLCAPPELVDMCCRRCHAQVSLSRVCREFVDRARERYT